MLLLAGILGDAWLGLWEGMNWEGGYPITTGERSCNGKKVSFLLEMAFWGILSGIFVTALV